MSKIKQKLHPLAKKAGYKSNDAFYKDFPTQAHYEQHMAVGGETMPLKKFQSTTTPYGTQMVDGHWVENQGAYYNRPTVDGWQVHPDNIISMNQGWEGFGDPNSLIKTPQPGAPSGAMPFSPVPRGVAKDNPDNFFAGKQSDNAYSIDAIRQAKKGRKVMDDGGMNLKLNSSQMIMGALSGADALVTKYLYNPQIAAAEAKTRHNLMMPVTAPNQFYGEGQGMYAAGGKVRGKGDYSYAPYSANGGRIDDQFESANPNTIVEGGEHMILPNGLSSPIVGDQHSDASGGEPREYPSGTKIISKKLRGDKDFATEVTGSKFKKSVPLAQLAKRFDTKKAAENMKSQDPITARTGNLVFGLQTGKLDEIFDYQETLKDPMYFVKKSFGGATLAGNGTKVGDYTNRPYRDDSRGDGFDDGAPIEQLKTKDPLDFNYSTRFNPDPSLTGPRMDDGSFTSDQMPQMSTNGLTMPTLKDEPASTPPPSNSKFKFNGVKGLGNLLPEAFAAVQNMTNFPIYAGKINPTYIKPAETNVQAALNRNQATANSQMMRNTGNASIDNARGASAAASLYDANNQVGQNKFNADQQTRQSSDVYNAQSKTKADEYNLGSMDNFWTKVTQRKANQEQSNQNMVESAYQKMAQRRLEDKSLGIYNQMMKDWEYDPVTGKYKPKKQNVAKMPVMQTTV